MDRRLIFPAVAITAWAQQPAQPPGAAEAEAALKARVDEFYKLQVEKKFRQAELLVADDSKDDYYNRAKQQISGYTLQQVEMSDNNSRAKVTVKAKVTLRAALVGAQEFELPLMTRWKIENGQWMWYVDPETKGETPFGKFAAAIPDSTKSVPSSPPHMDVKTLISQVTLDPTSVTLNASNPEQIVTVTNHLPGAITLELIKPHIDGISIDLKNADLKAGENGTILFHRTSDEKSSGVVRVLASPLNQVYEIQVRSN